MASFVHGATFRMLSSLSLLLFKPGLQVLLRSEEAGLLGRTLRQLDPLLLELFELQHQVEVSVRLKVDG